jgi:gamma-glutamyl-gamma-aminobutyrate hydrolase PuuD
MQHKSVYIEGERDGSYHDMWRRWGWEVIRTPMTADVIQFTGGEDVNPALYDEVPHPMTYFHNNRDEYCIDLFQYAKANGIKMAGICRGGQFLNVINGGKMFQHCDGHGIWGVHDATIIENGNIVQVTSTHHQIMRPNRDKGIVLMEAEKLGTFKEHMEMYDDGGKPRWTIENKPEEDDVEAVFYPDTMSLCFQPHPEYCDEKSSCVSAYKSFLRNYLELDV